MYCNQIYFSKFWWLYPIWRLRTVYRGLPTTVTANYHQDLLLTLTARRFLIFCYLLLFYLLYYILLVVLLLYFLLSTWAMLYSCSLRIIKLWLFWCDRRTLCIIFHILSEEIYIYYFTDIIFIWRFIFYVVTAGLRSVQISNIT